jgi:hypothetical protein
MNTARRSRTKVAQAAKPAVSQVANLRARIPARTRVVLLIRRLGARPSRLAVGETADKAVCATLRRAVA